MLPPQGSRADTGMLRAFNARTRAARKLAGTDAEPVADGVWRVRGGVPREMNVYLIADDGGGVTVFDAGVRSMAAAIGAAASGAGRRSTASCSGTRTSTTAARAAGSARPILCHPDERDDAEGDGGLHYFHIDRLRAARAAGLPAAAASCGTAGR